MKDVSPLTRAFYFVRSLLFWVSQIFATLLMGGPVLIASLFSWQLGYRLAVIWTQMNIYALKWICGVDWHVEGLEHLPDRASIVLSKHQSTWETYFLAGQVPEATYVAKRSLTWIPVFGWAIAAVRFILIDRKAGRSAIKQLVEQGSARLAEGRWIVMFPEGTRKSVGDEPNYRIGGAILAVETGAPVVPVAHNSGLYWPRMGFIKWPGTIEVRIGPAIDPKGKKAEQVLAETQAWIEARMAEII